MAKLTAASRRRIDEFRQRVRGMRYEPLPEGELSAIPDRRRQGLANSEIEGIHLTPEERAFLQMLDEERVPHELRLELATALALAAEDRSAAAD
ncbi:MAG TPA: hypothetical protein VNB28_02310 [Methylomirabilota bacterium]|jgi:hypothetical protein|nr:hypothetical protein [Methylomirabilota bacterium]